MSFLIFFSKQKTKIILASIALLTILLVSGALPTTGAFYSSSNNTQTSTSSTSSTILKSAPATSVGTAGRFLSGPFTVKPTFTASPTDPASPSNNGFSPPSLNPKPGVPQNGNLDPPTVSCPSVSCDSVSTSSGGALTNPLGLNTIDSTVPYSALAGVPGYIIEPPDQGLCANSQYVMEILNIGELQVYDASTLQPLSKGFATLDNLMGLASHGAKGWSSSGDISCLFDYSNGGHWIITEIVSASPEKPLVAGGSPGPFQGCFVAVPNTCLEGIAVSATSSPFSSYNVYFLNPDKVNHDPGASSGVLLNDFAKIGTTRDAFMVFYDEFNLGVSPTSGFGSHGFNGAQEFAFNKNSLEMGVPASKVTVAYENMGLAKNLYPIPADNGFQPASASCSSGIFAGIICWYEVIPAQTPDPTQFDNSHGGTGFMIASLDFLGAGDNRVAVFDWTGLSGLNSASCSMCKGIQFGGQIITSEVSYMDEGAACLVQFGGFCGLGDQKAGPIPLGDNCYLTAPTQISHSCPESGIATNGDSATQASFADGQLWTAISTVVIQTFGAKSELHIGAAFWAVGAGSFDSKGVFSVTTEGYVTAAHEDIEMPSIAGIDTGGALMAFTLSGNDYFPSTAFGGLATTSAGLTGGVINVADMGMSPQDGFTEYQGFPGLTRPRWGDYSQAIYVPSMGVFFSTEFIQHANCADSAFLSGGGSCGGTRVQQANWGSSVNLLGT